MKQLYRYMPRKTLEEIYKLYVRPHLDYGDVIYHMPDTESLDFSCTNDNIHPLMARVESVQYKAALVVSGAWKGTSKDRLYQDLGWESLYHRRSLRRLCIFYDVLKNKYPTYLSDTVELCITKTNKRHLHQNKILS